MLPAPRHLRFARAVSLVAAVLLGLPAVAASRPAGKPPAAPAFQPGPLADFGVVAPPPQVEHLAHWAAFTRDHRRKSFAIIDKKQAQLWVFDPQARLVSYTPILLGKAVGDDLVPGSAQKPPSRIEEDEKRTPAGRFVLEPGENLQGEDVLWLDFGAAISIHRMRSAERGEHRSRRMKSLDPADNRISYGCVNVPREFYDVVLKPAARKHGVVVYVLPETRTPQQQFGSFEVVRRTAAG